MFVPHFIDYQLRRSLKHVIVHVTNHCNFRCKHCFIDFSPKRDLPLERYQKLGKELGPLYWVDFAGGEPYIRKDIADIVASFDAQVLTIPTNGFFVDKTINMTREIRKKVKGELTISISVDGLKETHDKIRQEGSWDRLWESFEALKAMPDVRVKINTVLCRENFEEMLPLMEQVYERRPDFHSIILLRGSSIDPTYGLPSIEELRKFQEPMFEILRRYDYGHGKLISHMLRNYHRTLWNTSLKTIETNSQIIPCLAGKAHAVVMANGDVSACEMLPAVGNIKEKEWLEVWNSEAAQRQRDSIQAKECACTHNCAMLFSILFRPASYPGLLGKVDLVSPQGEPA